MVITTEEWLLAIAGHPLALGSSHAPLSAVSTSQALILSQTRPSRHPRHTKFLPNLTLRWLDGSGPRPDDVWHCRNLRPAICWAIPVWRYAGRRGGTCRGDVRNVFDSGLREVSFPLRTSEVFWTAR